LTFDVTKLCSSTRARYQCEYQYARHSNHYCKTVLVLSKCYWFIVNAYVLLCTTS